MTLSESLLVPALFDQETLEISQIHNPRFSVFNYSKSFVLVRRGGGGVVRRRETTDVTKVHLSFSRIEYTTHTQLINVLCKHITGG